MSGVVGLFRRDSRPVDGAELERMTERLAHRGPDGGGVWIDGPAGLGHRLLTTTPESLHEKLPLADPTGALAITADARLDNREELIGALGLGDRPAGELTDAELILRAYACWGERCAERLLGDFAFALWDRRARTLVCARDALGLRPLYYWSGPQAFACASEVKALLALPEVPRRLNELRIAHHLVQCHDDRSVTAYEGILRLLPGHTLTARADDVRLREYWAPDPTRELRLGSDEACADAFREAFTDAVRRRLRRAVPLGVTLSGGLDSSSVVGVARGIFRQEGAGPLPTFSALFPDLPRCDERPFIDAVVALGGVEPHFLRGDRLDPLSDFDRLPWHEDETLYASGYYMHGALFRAARDQGVRIVLEGLSGDLVVSHGGAYLNELARAGRFLALAREMAGLSRAFRIPMGRLCRSVAVPLVPWRLRTLSRPLRYRGRPRWNPIVSLALARRVDLDGRLRARERRLEELGRDSRTDQWRRLTSVHFVETLEAVDAAAAAVAVEVRDPFLDRRLAELCLALPVAQKIRRGRTRVVLRHAMAALLPPEVRDRGGKAELHHMLPGALAAHGRDRVAALFRDSAEALAPYVDLAALRRVHERHVAGGTWEDAHTVWRAATLARWLRKTAHFTGTSQ